MILIVLSVLQSVLIFITFKLFTRLGIENLQALVANYLVACLCGFALYRDPLTLHEIPNANWLPFAILLGATFISTFYVFALSNQKAGIALTSVTSKMSVVVPVMAGVILYGDRLKPLIVAGIIAALVAFYLTFRKKNDQPVSLKLIAIPIGVFLGNGLVDTMMKYAEFYYVRNNLFLFLAFVFLTCFTIGTIILIIRIILKKSRLMWKHLAAGVVLGLLNFGSTYYLMRAMDKFDSAVLFPVTNASIVGLSAMTGFFVFREKLSWINWLGVILSVIAIIIIANA